MSKLIIFDLDGVLVDACEWHRIALNIALKEIAGFEITLEEHVKVFNGLPTRKKLQMLSSKKRLSPNLHNKIYNRKQEKTVELITSESYVHTQKRAMVESLKSKGHNVACFTNSIRQTAELMLTCVGVIDLLDMLVTNEDVTNPKPDPEGYLKIMNNLKRQPTETIIIEDSLIGLAAANATKARVLSVRCAADVSTQLVETFITTCKD